MSNRTRRRHFSRVPVWPVVWGALCSPALGVPCAHPLDIKSTPIDTAQVTPSRGSDVPLFRVFLKDGASLVSYGEFARVGDQVVFSLSLGTEADQPRLQLITIPAGRVDWEQTQAYARSVQAAHYAATRGEADFERMSAEVAQLLGEIALSNDGADRLLQAENARRMLVAWPAQHHGYRADHVRQVVALLDEVISQFQAASGGSDFAFSLVAVSDAEPTVPLLPPPTLKESIEIALTAAAATPVPAERLSLLQSAAVLLDESDDEAWVKERRAVVDKQIAGELAIERAYTDLAQSIRLAASEATDRADVRGINRLEQTLRSRDAELGQLRPNVVQALVDELAGKRRAALDLRQERIGWASRFALYQAYRQSLRKPLEQFSRTAPVLERIRSLAGPSHRQLRQLEERLGKLTQDLDRLRPPRELRAVHTAFQGATRLGEHAARGYDQSLSSRSEQMAWDASAAAAGALMLFNRARVDLSTALQPPRPK